MVSTIPGIWMAALLNLMVYSFLIKETRLFRFAEYSMIGVSAGYVIVQMAKNLKSLLWLPLTIEGKYVYILALVLGVLLYTSYSRKYRHLSIWGIAFIIGVSTALMIRGTITAQVIGQTKSTFLTILNIDNIIIVLFTLSSLSYFFFTRAVLSRAQQPFRILWKVGRYAMMIAFGATYGGAVMTRINVIVARLSFLLFDWLGLSS